MFLVACVENGLVRAVVRPGGWGGGASVDGSHGGHSSTRRAFSSTPHPTPNSPTPPSLPFLLRVWREAPHL